MNTFTHFQKEVETVFLKGFEKATDSFSSMIQDKVKLENLRIMEEDSPNVILEDYLKEKPFVFITEIIGEVKGKSYFILSQAEIDSISDQLMSQMQAFKNHDDYKEILLKEIDNVISAAVISEFSNACSLKIYGDVPLYFNYEEMTKNELKKHLIPEKNRKCIISKATFSFESLATIQPIFLWNLDQYFFSNLYS